MKRYPAGIFPSEDSLPGSLKNGRFYIKNSNLQKSVFVQVNYYC